MKNAKKILIVTTILILGVGGSALNINAEDADQSNIIVKNVDDTTIQIIVNNPTYNFEKAYFESQEFTQIKIPDQGYASTPGDAKLPIIKRFIEIPADATPDIKINSILWENNNLEKMNLPTQIMPVQPSIIKTEARERTELFLDEDYYNTNKFLQTETVKITDIGMIRGCRVALVEISPVQYNPTTGDIKLLTNCEVTIDLIGSDLEKTYRNYQKYYSEDFEELYATFIENHDYYLETLDINPKNTEGYLIITHDSFYDEILPFSNWKQSIGFDVTVTNTSAIPGGVSKTNIYNYIYDAYYNWTNPPAFVLLVGDIAEVPTYTGTTGWPGPAGAVDLYYVTVNGSDYFEDIFIGRFSSSDENEITAMVDKTVYYEQGNFADDSWAQKATFMAGNSNYQITEGTHNYVISNFLDSNNYTCDKLYEETYGATTQDARDSLNAGRSLAVFSGHGSTTSWGDGPAFSQSDVQGLTNLDMYPFVCSHACLTGSFQLSECFGETWIRQADKAGLAFWGASESTLWDEDDILERGMFEGWWQQNLETIGAMTEYGLYQVYENYSGGGYTKYYFEAYNILGDPSVKIWRNNPMQPGPATITNLQNNWNFISNPFNQSVALSELKIKYNGADYTWAEATTNNNPTGSPILNSNLFGWNRNSQTYLFATTLEPGQGYWTYVYTPCELWADGILPIYESFITNIQTNWNIIGVPQDESVDLTDLVFNFNGVDYTWAEATSTNNPTGNPIVNPNIFGWNRDSQSYTFASALNPGEAYWVYAYDNCIMYKN